MTFFEGVYGPIFTYLIQDLKKGSKNGPFSGFPGGGPGNREKGSKNLALLLRTFLGHFSGSFGVFWGFLGNCHQKRGKHLHCAQLIWF